MRSAIKVFIVAAVMLLGACGGGGGDSSDGNSTPDFTGQYQGAMNRVINTCKIGFDWDDIFFVEHEGDSLILQVGERYPERYTAIVTSPNSFEVQGTAETSGSCTSQGRYDFTNITESSAVVRWTINYSKGCFLDLAVPCTVAYEGVLPRS